MRCPTCFSVLQDKNMAPAWMLYKNTAQGTPKYLDEEAFWCPACQELIFEEDFLYTTQE